MQNKKKTTEEFIKEAIGLHRDKYDYSNVIYLHSKEDVKIFCNNCKLFFNIKPHRHLDKKYHRGCSCYNKKKRKSLKKFIEESNNIYGDIFDYSNVKYKSIINDTVKIICKLCNHILLRTPYYHLNCNFGCKECIKIENAKKRMIINPKTRRKTTEEFIKEATRLHRDKYDYSLVDYINNKTSVKIKCNKCLKIFDKIPKKHITRRSGCSSCSSNSIGEDTIREKCKKYNIFYVEQLQILYLDRKYIIFFYTRFKFIY